MEIESLAGAASMLDIEHDAVLSFISRFGSDRDVFLHGMCYWFAYILQGRFGGVMMYERVENHFMQEIGGRLYDASGDVTERYGKSPALMKWADMPEFDSSLYKRLLRDCVYKMEKGFL